MKAVLALLTITAMVGTALFLMQNNSSAGNIRGIPAEIHDMYRRWQQEHGIFEANLDDSKVRTFYQNHLKVETHNANPLKTFSMKLNQFAQMTVEEFKQFYLTLKSELKESNNEVLLSTTGLPSSVDWRKQGAVRDVKDQGQCGSCWSFSTTGSLEGLQSVKKLGNDVFSEQQLVDCSLFYGNFGCHGGMMDRAYKYVMKHGITTEDKYPYKAAGSWFCKQNSGDFKITGFNDVKQGDVEQLAAAVAQQPVSVAVDASKWQFYESGVYSDCTETIDHGVLVVGYDSDAWIVKNSWSTKWGESGYIRLKRGNTCGLANTASYPTM